MIHETLVEFGKSHGKFQWFSFSRLFACNNVMSPTKCAVYHYVTLQMEEMFVKRNKTTMRLFRLSYSVSICLK